MEVIIPLYMGKLLDNGINGNGGEGDAVADGNGQALPVLCTEALGDHNAGTGGNTYEQGHQQVQNGHGGTDCGQGQVTFVHADDDGVGGVVELLGKVTQKHGDGEFQNPLPR